MHTKNLKPGYQGHDAMRENAQKLLNHPGHEPDVYSTSAMSKSKMRPFNEGGHVKKEEEKCGGCKYTAGNVAKTRLGQSTSNRMPKDLKKRSCKK